MIGATDEELRILIEDKRKFLREDLEDFETNQQAIGMKFLFGDSQLKCGKEHILVVTNARIEL